MAFPEILEMGRPARHREIQTREMLFGQTNPASYETTHRIRNKTKLDKQWKEKDNV